MRIVDVEDDDRSIITAFGNKFVLPVINFSRDHVLCVQWRLTSCARPASTCGSTSSAWSAPCAASARDTGPAACLPIDRTGG